MQSLFSPSSNIVDENSRINRIIPNKILMLEI